MARIEDIARAVLQRDTLTARSLVQDLDRSALDLSSYPAPHTDDLRVLTMSAALVSLFALRRHVDPPAWTRNAGRFPEPFYTSRHSLTIKAARDLLEAETPEVLRQFNVYAGPDFLAQV